MAPRRISAWNNKKKYKPLSCAQNSTEGPTPHAQTEIGEMSVLQLEVWSQARQITLSLWGLE